MATQQESVKAKAKQPPKSMPSGTEDAIALLETDHHMVEEIFDEFNALGGGQRKKKAQLAQRACDALAMHTAIEEDLLYPAASKALKGDDRREA